MTKSVFLSGSINIDQVLNEINQEILLTRLNNMISNNLKILIGDANGADTYFQNYFYNQNYHDVIIYHSTSPTYSKVRNNIGNWNKKSIFVNYSRIQNWKLFYSQKDIAMANDADYGLVLWNGNSSGSYSNLSRLLKMNKPVLLFSANHYDGLLLKTIDDVKNI